MANSSISSNKVLSKIARSRLQKELLDWHTNPLVGFTVKPSDNIQRWVIEMTGPSETVYSNQTYHLQIDFPEDYPMHAPPVMFQKPVPLHPLIYSTGHTCVEILYYSWTPAITVKSICLSILSMLSSPLPPMGFCRL